VPWSTRFESPVILPSGELLVTLKDAADYITKLPEDEANLAQWQIAIEALMLCSVDGHPMLAQMAVQKALNRNVVIPFSPDAAKHRWARRKLKRDE
jgi:hypothetical protein